MLWRDHPHTFAGTLRGRKGAARVFLGRLSRLRDLLEDLTQQCNHKQQLLRQKAQQSAILCDRQRLGGPRVPSAPLPQAPLPLAQQWALEQPGSEKESWSNGGWRRKEANNGWQKNPIKEQG